MSTDDRTTPAGAQPGDLALARRPGFLLSQLGFHGAERFAERLGPLDLRGPHFGLLTLLAARDGQSQQQLADTMGIHRNAMVGLVDELEERGLVQRRRHPSDRRAHAVHLTSDAGPRLAAAQHAADEHDAELLAPLDQAERRQLVTLLQRVADHAGLAPGVHPGARAPAGQRQSKRASSA